MPPGPAPTDARYLNRELSWLDFNARVLALAEDADLPLLERVKFAAIFSANLDEFFQVRVAGLKDQFAAGVSALSIDGRTASEQLVAIGDRVRDLVARQQSLLGKLIAALAAEHIAVVGFTDLDDEARAHLRAVFDARVYPVLTPLAVDPSHPFPYISGLSLNLAVKIVDPADGQSRFARVKIPPTLPRLVPLPDGRRWVLLEDVVSSQLEELFPAMAVEGAYLFRVTRNSDLDLDGDDADDLLVAVETELRRRRFGGAVRLEVGHDMPDDIVVLLLDELELERPDVTTVDHLLDPSALWSLVALDRPALKYPAWSPKTPVHLTVGATGDFFAALRNGDILLHHPYDSFAASVERFVSDAAHDPDVLAIKITLYRTSRDSPIARALIDAVEAGKQVAVLVELKARFDEQANIEWARQLEEAGVHVVYGVVGLKTHTKVAQVVRLEHGELRRYSHVATGNYNSDTARIYEDLGVLSADPTLGDDLTRLFNSLTGYGMVPRLQRLVVAPQQLRSRILALIAGELPTGDRAAGRIVMKMNSLVDRQVIDALDGAAAAGVTVELVIRGICCLVPRSPDITVRSIVGRYLEHSRIYHFANGNGPGYTYWAIGSADMMPRNLDARVEAVVEVTDVSTVARLAAIVDVLLDEGTTAWHLGPDGRWSLRRADGGPAKADPQVRFQEHVDASQHTHQHAL